MNTMTASANGMEDRSEGRPIRLRLLKFAIVTFLGIAALNWTWNEYNLRQWFEISNVRIGGDINYLNPARVKDVVNVHISNGLVNIDVDSLRGDLKDLPWVKVARVWRRWPSALEIEVVEQKPLARWGETEALNSAGEVFTPDTLARLVHLPVLAGPAGQSEHVAKTYSKMTRILEASGFGVARLELTDRLTWIMTLTTGTVLYMGSEGAEEKLKRFSDSYGLLRARYTQRPAIVDLRYSNGFAVAWGAKSQNGVVADKPATTGLESTNVDGTLVNRNIRNI